MNLKTLKTFIFFVWSQFIVFSAEAKKLQINKCILANGTIAYQENKCENIELKPPKKQVTQPGKSKRQLQGKSTVMSQTKKKTIAKTVSPLQFKTFKTSNNPTQKLIEKVGRFTIAIDVLSHLRFFSKVYSSKLWHMKFVDNQVNPKFSVLIDFIFPDNKNFSHPEIEELVYLLGSRFITKSKERRVNIKSLNVNNGKGAIATFTNIRSQYKYTTKGVVFKGKWLIQFTVLSNDLSNNDYNRVISSLEESIRINSF